MTSTGKLSSYVRKKDRVETIVAQKHDALWGGTVTLANGWVLALPEMAAGTKLPITVEARRLSGGD
jgi:nitrogen fixation protein NifT